MSLLKLVARLSLLALVFGGVWSLGCALVVGADDYKVAGGGAGSGGACVDPGSKCDSASSCCSGLCFDLTLDVSFGKFCAASCTSGDGCQSGCCIVQGGQMGCAPRGFCAATCAAPHTSCTDSTDCCLGSRCICLSSPCTATTAAECRKLCKANAECDTGCCAALVDGVTKVCSEPAMCAAQP